MGRLDGKVAIITGAAGGIGACEAGLFAREGAKVVATDIDASGVEAVVRAIGDEGGDAIALRHDVSSEGDWRNVVAAAVAQYGKVNVLVNNAAIHRETRFADITLDEWEMVLKVDLTGTFLGIQAVIPDMLRGEGGSIVNMSSIAAVIGGSFAHYSAAKGGIISLTKATAIEYARQGIRANVILPGLIETNLTKDALANPEIRKMLEDSTALPRFGQSEDIAYCALYLASDEAGYATGAEFVIDGGNTAK